MTGAVVFAYHNVGYQCLQVLLKHKLEVSLVVTHTDNPAETIWFDSVAGLAAAHNLPVIAPANPNDAETVARVRALQPDFLFSFYSRNMLAPPLLAAPRLGALNMHGSLLPKYRGRVPVNWVVINGEMQTGATLHYMTAKPDAGDMVDQQAVPIQPDDTAADVFGKVTAAAAAVLDRSLPELIAGTAPRIPLDLARGSYFGGRKPADGRIDWGLPAARIHNLVRGVAPPYPGAFTTIAGTTLRILRTRLDAAATAPPGTTQSRLCVENDQLFAVCADGGILRIMETESEGRPFTAADFRARFAATSVNLEIEPQ
jgi:methionyl-tRNA formyltransferase